jgi:hypothetical protein
VPVAKSGPLPSPPKREQPLASSRASRYLDGLNPAILASACKHSLSAEDDDHANQHPVRVLVLDDITMLIGSGRAGVL